MLKHLFSKGSQLYYGLGRYAPLFGINGRTGAPLTPLTQVSLGAPITLDTDGLMAAATGAELPNDETITYTFSTDGGTTPLDGANTDGILDTARNVTLDVSHATSIVAMTVLVTGKDTYDAVMSELLTVTATGTSKAVNGKKAFKQITSIAVASAADATTNTLNVGWGDVLGLPYKLDGAYDVVSFFADTTEESASATFVAGDTTVATTTTGDTRGTVTPNTATDGSVEYRVWMRVSDASSAEGLVGVPQG